MISQLFRKQKELTFERAYPAEVERVWDAWTKPNELRQWWGPAKTTIPTCEVDLRVGGAISIVMEAGEGMGKYAGTRWPMEATITVLNPTSELSYDARSWTDGSETETTIRHTNTVRFSQTGETTTVHLHIVITDIGPGAKMAAFGMKMGYKQYFDKLNLYLTAP